MHTYIMALAYCKKGEEEETRKNLTAKRESLRMKTENEACRHGCDYIREPENHMGNRADELYGKIMEYAENAEVSPPDYTYRYLRQQRHIFPIVLFNAIGEAEEFFPSWAEFLAFRELLREDIPSAVKDETYVPLRVWDAHF